MTQALYAHHPSLKVSIAKNIVHAVPPAFTLFRGELKLLMLQAATCIQPLSASLSRQLHCAFRPASTQLQRPWRCSLPLRALRVTPTPTEVTAAANDASKAASGNAPRVKAAFAKTGLSQDAIGHILTQYPHYLRWDVEQKLLPAMQCWQKELDDQFVSEFERIPTLLHRPPEEDPPEHPPEQLKDQYLVSIGIRSLNTLRRRYPKVYRQPLSSLQRRVAFLQQCGFTRSQTLSLIEQHSDILSRPSEHVDELLRVIGDMFGCADREMLCNIMLRCRCIGVFQVSPATLHHKFTYFCTCIGVDDKEMQRAWKYGVFKNSPAELDIRLDSIAAHLNSNLDEAKAMVRSMPQLMSLLPATVELHVTQLLGLGFSHGQVRSMCLRQPVLLTYSYSSDVRVAKWGFLTCILRLNHDAIVAKPHLLMSSLPNRLGPRWEYLQQLRLLGVIAFAGAHEVLNSLVYSTDSQFRAAYTTPQLRVYDAYFQKQWQRKWNFLLIDQQLGIQDIADNPALLHISLKDT